MIARKSLHWLEKVCWQCNSTPSILSGQGTVLLQRIQPMKDTNDIRMAAFRRRNQIKIKRETHCLVRKRKLTRSPSPGLMMLQRSTQTRSPIPATWTRVTVALVKLNMLLISFLLSKYSWETLIRIRTPHIKKWIHKIKLPLAQEQLLHLQLSKQLHRALAPGPA